MSLFAELKRRNVFKIAIAYGITSWVIAQMAELAADSFLAPDWVMKMIITILILGFPVALVMAWAYEMTPDGLRRETEDETDPSTNQSSGKLDRTIVIALITALAYIAYDKLVIDTNQDTTLLKPVNQQTLVAPDSEKTTGEPESTEQSIAVLPFVNMSDDAGNEYFSEGLSEELLNQLVKIPELRVAARTSSFSFKGKDVKVAQIAEELNVTHVLEGSVRKAGNHVRITAQLIKADDGFHLWSETYDRTLDDIFVVQDEIANEVVASLKVTLMGTMPEVRQTDPEVYALYLQGKHFNNLRSEDNLEKAEAAFTQALLIDPEYAPAWIGLSQVYHAQTRSLWRPQQKGFALAREAVDKALAIDGNSAAAWATLAFVNRAELNWEGAQFAIDRARQLEPNNVDVLNAAASLARTLGQFAVSTSLHEHATALDPLNQRSLYALARTYIQTGRFEKAFEKIDRLLALNPNRPGGHILLGRAHLFNGDPERALIETNKEPSSLYYHVRLAKVHYTLGNEAQSQASIEKLLASSARTIPGPIGSMYAWRGENDLAFEWFDLAFKQQDFRLSNFLGNEWLRGLESDPRYPVLLEKIGLLEAWKAMPKPDEDPQQ